MNKNKLFNILNIALFVTITLAIFICFCPMLTFLASQDGKEYLFALDGMSLLVNDSKALYWDTYDTIKFKGVLFPKSNMMILSFVFQFIILGFVIFLSLIRSRKNLDKFLFPIINLFALTNIIFSSMIFTTYSYDSIIFSMGYGLYLYIVFNVIVFLIVSSLTFITFSHHKNCKD